jgi:hypothetical protein
MKIRIRKRHGETAAKDLTSRLTHGKVYRHSLRVELGKLLEFAPELSVPVHVGILSPREPNAALHKDFDSISRDLRDAWNRIVTAAEVSTSESLRVKEIDLQRLDEHHAQ